MVITIRYDLLATDNNVPLILIKTSDKITNTSTLVTQNKQGKYTRLFILVH